MTDVLPGRTIGWISLLLTASLLSACGGGAASAPATAVIAVPGEAPPATPAAPTLTLAAIKTLRLSWADGMGETEYRVLEDPDGSSGYRRVATLAADTTQHDHQVFLPTSAQARYVLQACNGNACADSAAVAVAGAVAPAIGYLKASNAYHHERFGASMSLSADGQTLAVGAPDEHGANADPDNKTGFANGAVYVFTRSNGHWQQTAYLKASNTDPYDRFGFSVTLSADGQTLAVGAPGEGSVGPDPLEDNGSDNGAVYVFTRIGDAWQQTAYLKAAVTDPADKFGDSLAISALSVDGQTLVIGAPGEDGATSDPNDNNGADNGAVYVFTRSGDTWQQRAFLKAAVTDQYDNFGDSLSLSADGLTLAVGAAGENSATTDPHNNGSLDSGAAYVFTRSGDAWQQQAFLKATVTGGNDLFGSSLALSPDGRALAIGAPGEYSAGTDPLDNSGVEIGAAYIFTRSGDTWQQQAYLKAFNTGLYDRFGTSLALSAGGQRLVVGAPGERSNGSNPLDDSGLANGAAYVFTRSGDTWLHQAYVKAPNTGAYDHFGASLALSSDGQTLAVGADREGSAATGIGGAQGDDSAPDAGAVYLY